MTDDVFNNGLSRNNETIRISLKTLRQLGLDDQAQQIMADATSSYNDILNDPERSDSWKRQQSAARYISVVNSVANKLSSAASKASTQLSDDKGRVYGIVGLKGDYASLQVAHRDALVRVNEMNPADSSTRRQLLANAIDHGDETLAHALVESAVQNRDADTVNDFEAAYPQLAAAAERLWEFTHRKASANGLIAAMQSVVLKPTVLTGLQDYEIEAAAAGNTNVGRWNVGR